jgi:transposase-like protein
MVTILREAVAKKHGISDQTIYAWRQRYGTLEAADVKRLRGPVNKADASLTSSTTPTADNAAS